MGAFNIDKKQEGDSVVMQFEGILDEAASFGGVELSGGNKYVFDLEKVSAINSCGIREWVNWLKTGESAQEIVYKNCPKIIVDQINMVAGFLPNNGKVESFYVPYYCDETGAEKMILFKHGAEFKEGEVNPPDGIKDDETGDEMEMDVIEAKYFKFIKK
tara:strand:+ start:584 stop:1060 length:477 start_codon:yes stop_codon:yes gene_type:complete